MLNIVNLKLLLVLINVRLIVCSVDPLLRKNVHESIKARRNINKSDEEQKEGLPGSNGLSNLDNISLHSYNPTILETQPFPQWLSDFTGMSQWPGPDPPYVPLNFIDVESIPKFEPHQMGVCPSDRSSCSFDCYKCVAADDVYTCPKLSQTFDDGPTVATSTLIAGLKHKTTFFTLGMNVVKYPEIYHEVLEKGHLVGTHTWSHKFLPSLTNEQIIAQIQWSIWAMNATGNHLPKWFRPPYGGIDNRVRHITRLFGLQAVLWDYDTFDWQLLNNQRTEDQIYAEAESWLNQPDNEKRGLILEHDAHARTVKVAFELSNNIIGNDQLTVAECVDGVDYIRTFDISASSVNFDQ